MRRFSLGRWSPIRGMGAAVAQGPADAKLIGVLPGSGDLACSGANAHHPGTRTNPER
jgi:hypothetical protein